MEKQIFMKVLETRSEMDEFKKRLEKDPDCPYHYTQVVPLGKSCEVNNTRIVVLYVHTHEVE